ncbi:MAG: TIGR01777 family oxidoreductase [Bacteroidia bacterium]
MKKILIAGGSGLIGSRLTEMLLQKGYSVSHLSRKAGNKNGVEVFEWNIDSHNVDANAFKGVDTIINLAGAGIADKAWTASRMKEIIDSRKNAAQTIFNFLKNNPNQVTNYIGASAIGYYGNLTKHNLAEEDIYNEKDFMTDCCTQWEDAHHQISTLNIRTTIFRIGIVLSTKGGALKEMMNPFKFFTGAYFGDGNIMTSWIHIDDLCEAIIYTIENKSIEGVYNAVASNPVTNKELIKAISKIKTTLIIMPVPKFVLQIMLGKRHVILFQSLHVSNKKILITSFKFKFEKINEALTDLLK